MATTSKIIIASIALFCALGTGSASAEAIQKWGEIEAVSVGPTEADSAVFFRVRWTGTSDGDSESWIGVHESNFGTEGVNRVQSLLVSAMITRSRMLVVFDDESNRLTAIRLSK